MFKVTLLIRDRLDAPPASGLDPIVIGSCLPMYLPLLLSMATEPGRGAAVFV